MKTLVSVLYAVGMPIYLLGLKLIAILGHKKAKLLVDGREETWKKLKGYDNSQPCIWIHAASLGEFEQGRPLIEAIRAKHIDEKIVLTFYSPSGYEVRKNYKEVDMVCYLPADSRANAKRFIESINPGVVFFVKYEFWYHFINQLNRRNIPLYGISMIFRKEQPFFLSWGEWFRSMLRKFEHIYVQDSVSADLLETIGILESKYTVAGDTRFDRVLKISESSPSVPIVEDFVKDAKKVIVMGSAWPPDDDILFPYICDNSKDVKLIVAPHEIHEERIKSLTAKLKVKYTLYTEPDEAIASSKVLVVNTIGLLSTIYKYGHIAYIGGGFGVGIHNTLEAATYSIPVIFGPNYKRFKEACDLIECGGGYSVTTGMQLRSLLDSFEQDSQKLSSSGVAAGEYVKSMCGATERIMTDIF
ncbi:MAG: 3-deoxy-D-manno-octulosonic acid transferase [Marinilabiliaceae bacterium]|nr:3-deoxy-D-manno-octulosonic acid transferase [Marinilabiliaceae bacterium]